ncbi:TPA: hypothetical protein ACGE2L_003887, partial [Acinetobacter baumannii]
EMRKDQIPDFVDEIFATGCPITAVGQDCYVLQRAICWQKTSTVLVRWSIKSASDKESVTICC